MGPLPQQLEGREAAMEGVEAVAPQWLPTPVGQEEVPIWGQEAVALEMPVELSQQGQGECRLIQLAFWAAAAAGEVPLTGLEEMEEMEEVSLVEVVEGVQLQLAGRVVPEVLAAEAEAAVPAVPAAVEDLEQEAGVVARSEQGVSMAAMVACWTAAVEALRSAERSSLV